MAPGTNIPYSFLFEIIGTFQYTPGHTKRRFRSGGSVQWGSPVLYGIAREHLRSLTSPVHFLDFNSVAFVYHEEDTVNTSSLGILKDSYLNITEPKIGMESRRTAGSGHDSRKPVRLAMDQHTTTSLSGPVSAYWLPRECKNIEA